MFAIATATGQMAFLTHANTWALAPSKNIRLFTTKREAKDFAKSNGEKVQALLSRQHMVLTADKTGGTVHQ